MLDIDIIDYVAAAPGPLACPICCARPPSLSWPQRLAQKVALPNPKYMLILLKIKWLCTKLTGGGRGPKIVY